MWNSLISWFELLVAPLEFMPLYFRLFCDIVIVFFAVHVLCRLFKLIWDALPYV